MTGIFGGAYAGTYDALYQEKDYPAECDLVERIFQTYGQGTVRTVLDLGCGTGNHAIPLAERGYAVTGVDRSQAMLAAAEEKAAAAGVRDRLVLRHGDVTDVDLGQPFDAALMMFAVLGYQYENAQVLAALRTVRRHLRQGGLFVFDVWYGPAVLTERPSQRVKTIETPGGTVLRVASGELDTRRDLCTVRYDVWTVEGDRVTSRTQESHPMRYFFPPELALLLECAGLELVRLGAFPDLEAEPDEHTWNVTAVARAV